MERSRRSLAALLIGILGGLAGLFTLGPSVAGCLGPLGVTGVQCAAATGRYPSVEFGGPVLAFTALAALVLLLPSLLTPVVEAGLATAIGALAGAMLYLAVRPQTWTGPTSTGEVITLTLPLDVWALLTAVILGAAAGLIVRAALRRTTMASAPA